MDKYEYRIKAEQIKKLVSEENYLSAMKIADTIDWRRVKNVSMLCQVSDIYEKNGKYEESHELLLIAYDRSPIGRMMVYKLAELAIKMEDYEEAIEYYREFVHLSPGDSAADILKYKIYKAKNATAKELIPILETFKQKEYHEEWAYELARLYHEAGMASKCVEECDDIILWFSEGQYVERAMELKMLYKPLTKEQQDKYRHRNDINGEPEDGYLDEDEEEEEQAQSVDTSKVVVMTEDMFNDSIDAMDIRIKPVNLGKYDTINLQAELAKSMEQIMSATEKETVDTTMNNIRRLVEDSQILDINFDDELENSEIKFDGIQVEVPTAPSMGWEEKQEQKPYKKVLAEESDGQINICMPENNILEKQITGQMRIEDVLSEWDKMKEAAEYAIKEAEQKRLNETKSRALLKAENIMAKLALVISEEELKNNGKEIAATLEASFLEDDSINEIAAALEANIEEVCSEEAKVLEKKPVEERNSESLELQETINIEELSDAEELLDTEELLDVEKLSDTIAEQTIQSVKAIENEKVKQEIKKQYTAEIIASEVIAELEAREEKSIIDESEEETGEEEYDDSAAKALEERITSDLPRGLEAIIAKELEGFEEDMNKSYSSSSVNSILTKEQQEIFAAFLSVRGVERALEKMFLTINDANSKETPFEVGDVVVMGDEQTGKTTLGMAIAKAVQMAQHKKSGKVAKITGSSLNSKDIRMMVDKMSGGVLIIEKAGSLSEKTIKNIMEALQEAKEEIMLILEDTKIGIESVLSKDKDFASGFTVKIELPEYNNDELVQFGKEYAKTLMYSFDDMAILAFYTCLGNIQIDDVPVTIEQVKEIIDMAISKSNKKKIKKLKDIIMSRRYDDERRVILQESDFEDIYI